MTFSRIVVALWGWVVRVVSRCGLGGRWVCVGCRALNSLLFRRMPGLYYVRCRVVGRLEVFVDLLLLYVVVARRVAWRRLPGWVG